MLTSLTNRYQPSRAPASSICISQSNSTSCIKPKSPSSNLTADTGALSSDDSSLDVTIPSSDDSILSLESLEEGTIGVCDGGFLLQAPLLQSFQEPTKPNRTRFASMPTSILSSWLDYMLEPRISQGRLSIPLQSQARSYLKYLIVVPILTLASSLFFVYYWVPILLRNGAIAYVDNLIMGGHLNRWSLWLLLGIPMLYGLVSDISHEIMTCHMLCRGRRYRELPSHMPRLTHAVIICNYKEPLEVLRATVQSLTAQNRNSLAANTMIVLACEARDPTAHATFQALHQEFAKDFKAFVQTNHVLAPGEVIGKSSNENFACRELYRMLRQDYPDLDPFQVMVTTCDADSLFDGNFLRQVEAEYYRMPDGRRFLYNAPISTYRNLSECHWLVRCFEIRRCQYDTFTAGTFRPTQSNYSLTLGFAHEINYWDPSNTSEDFHTTLKAMAMTGKGDAVVVKVWSLILNDSVTDLKDRWVQAKRHMWGIEEVAFCASLFPVLRLVTWTSMMGLVMGQMYSVCMPAGLYLLMGPIRQAFFTLRVETQYWIMGLAAVFMIYNQIKVILREVFLHHFLLKNRPLMMQRSKSEWLQLVLGFPIISQLGFLLFATIATWRVLIHAVFHETLVYVTAPKALNTSTSTNASTCCSTAAVRDSEKGLEDSCTVTCTTVSIPSVIHHKQPKKGI